MLFVEVCFILLFIILWKIWNMFVLVCVLVVFSILCSLLFIVIAVEIRSYKKYDRYNVSTIDNASRKNEIYIYMIDNKESSLPFIYDRLSRNGYETINPYHLQNHIKEFCIDLFMLIDCIYNHIPIYDIINIIKLSLIHTTNPIKTTRPTFKTAYSILITYL
jgi:hypothetical protein